MAVRPLRFNHNENGKHGGLVPETVHRDNLLQDADRVLYAILMAASARTG